MRIIYIMVSLILSFSINAQISIGDKVDNINDFSFSNDGSLLVVPINDKIKIFETTNYNLCKEYKLNNRSSFSFVAISNSNNLIASYSDDDKLILWNLNTGDTLQELSVQHSITKIVFSPDDNFIVTGSSDNKINIYDTESLHPNGSLISHTDFITDLEFYDSNILISCSADGNIILWDISNEALVEKWEASNNWIRDISLNKDKSNIISCGDDGKMKIWNIEDFQKIELLVSKKMSFSWLMSCDYYNNEIYAIGGHSKRVYVYSPKINFTYKVKSYINKLSFVPKSDKLILAIATQGSGLKIISTAAMKVSD